jgi:HSP20 family molecular chaperone IbpA
MTRLTGLSSPFLLGFDQIEQMLDRIAKGSADAYPPYNIERLTAKGGADRLRITFAVAGFAAEELAVEVEDATLTVRGAQRDDDTREYLHRGIAARRFERAFVLAEAMEVAGAALENGLLAIDLTRAVQERVVRRIPIEARD